MTEEPEVQLKLREGHSSLILSTERSGIIARGRKDAAKLVARPESDTPVPLSKSRTRELAEQGNPVAQWILGFVYSSVAVYSSGGYVPMSFGGWDETIVPEGPRDYEEAVRWFRKAADQGLADAESSLGDAYNRGDGVNKDCAEAVRWYRKAADQGNPTAQLNLANMYYQGHGVPQDYTEAAQWYRKAAEQENGPAQYALGYMYAEGQGLSQDYTEAVRWYRKAADQGVADAQYALGLMYERGQGLPHDSAQAYLWVSLAASRAVGDDQQKFADTAALIAEGMTSAQIAEAQRLASAWKPN